MVNVKEMIEIDEINEMDCELKEMTRNINNEVWIDAEVMKHEQ